MHSFRSRLLLMLLLLVATPGPTDALRYEQKLVLVDMHNFYRSRVTPTAANMQKMYWDEDLAKFAEAYAQNCKWAPNPNRGERGESLYSLPGLEMNLPRSTWEWHHERYFYNFTTNTCKPKRTCHHYTQMVWAQSNKIGCGMHYCEKLQVKNEDKVYLLVCNYLSAGNKKGKRPYQEGPSCSLCPSIDRCESNLCVHLDEPNELQATRVHMGHTTSRSLPSSPNTSVTVNAPGGHTLTLQSSLSDEPIPEEPGIDLGIKPVIDPDIEADIQSSKEKATTVRMTTVKPTTVKTTTVKPTTVKTTTVKPTTVKTTTVKPTTVKTTTVKTTTVKPTTVKTTTVKTTTVKPTTITTTMVTTTTESTTTESTTTESTTTESTTTESTTTESTTTVKTTTVKTTMVKPNIVKPNKLKPSKVKPTKVKPSKLRPNSAPGHVWSTFLGLLLLPPLMLAGNF